MQECWHFQEKTKQKKKVAISRKVGRDDLLVASQNHISTKTWLVSSLMDKQTTGTLSKTVQALAWVLIDQVTCSVSLTQKGQSKLYGASMWCSLVSRMKFTQDQVWTPYATPWVAKRFKKKSSSSDPPGSSKEPRRLENPNSFWW